MNSSTLRIEDIGPEATAGARYLVTLLEGTPWTPGQQFAAAKRPELPAAEIRSQVLDRTADAGALGKLLGEFLLGNTVGEAWQTRQGRTYLDVRVSTLKNLPWEFARLEDIPLFYDYARPFSVSYAAAPLSRTLEWGIRVLLVIAAEDAADTIGVWREVYAIRNALREANRIIDMKPLWFPSRQRFREEIERYRPHVLHVIGHGNDAGLLLFDGANLVPWTAAQVYTDVNDWTWKPELVYLNTCRSAGGKLNQAGLESQSTVIDRFLRRGVAAVIAMQADVRGDLAGACAGRFYEKIAAGEEIDSALARGRVLIAQTVEGAETGVDSYLPKLVTSLSVEQVLRYHAQPRMPQCPEIEDSLTKFVDRDEQRRELVRLLEENRPVVLIEGPPVVGKTWLLQWCVDAWRRRNMDIRYVSIKGCRTWLDVVRAIRDGDARFSGNPAYISRGMGASQRAALNWRLNKLAEGISDPPPAAFQGNEVEDTASTQNLVDPMKAGIEPHRHAMSALHAILQTEANVSSEEAGFSNRPLVLILDNFAAGDEGLTEMHFAILQKHWIDTFVVPANSRIRVVLGLQIDQIREYNLETLPRGYSKVDLGFFRKEDFSDTILDLMPLLHRFENDQKKEKALDWVRKQLEIFNPTADGKPLSGPVVSSLCTDIYRYCIFMKGQWDSH